jgi:hypothetical protein
MESDDPDGRKPALLPLRSAFVLTLALLVALAVGGLLYVAHRSVALAVLGAGGAFAAAATLFNWMIELRSAGRPGSLPVLPADRVRHPRVRAGQAGMLAPAARPRK